ncbi:hypothetical protein D3C80_1414620 [compost metagenome]
MIFFDDDLGFTLQKLKAKQIGIITFQCFPMFQYGSKQFSGFFFYFVRDKPFLLNRFIRRDSAEELFKLKFVFPGIFVSCCQKVQNMCCQFRIAELIIFQQTNLREKGIQKWMEEDQSGIFNRSVKLHCSCFIPFTGSFIVFLSRSGSLFLIVFLYDLKYSFPAKRNLLSGNRGHKCPNGFRIGFLPVG